MRNSLQHLVRVFVFVLPLQCVTGNLPQLSSKLGISAENFFPPRSKNNGSCRDDRNNDEMVEKMRTDTPSVEKLAENTIHNFLTPRSKDEKFYIQGWRWHTLSLIRDSNRVQKYAQIVLKDATKDKVESLNIAVKHVIDFNLKGLQRIENETFFPWLRKKLVSDDVVGNKEASRAFQQILDSVDRDRKKVDHLESLMRAQTRSLVDPNNDAVGVENATFQISQMSGEISSITKSIFDRENRLLVPAVAKLVSSREQKSFNNKVLRNLGLLESRCHLVGMHDAVYDKAYGNAKEIALFKEQIPSVAQMMIGRWKKSLYEPKVGVLEEVGTESL